MDQPSAPLLRADISKIAVFRALRVGDMLCAVPALRALRQAAPQAHITLVGLPWAQQFASRYAHYVDDFVAFPGHPMFPEQPVQDELLAPFYAGMRARALDLAIGLHGAGPVSNYVVAAFGARLQAGFTAQPAPDDAALDFALPYPDDGPEPQRLLSLMRWLGAGSHDSALEFPITADDEAELAACDAARALVPGAYLCLHPGASRADKCWPLARFAALADQLADQTGLAIVLTGSQQEAALTAALAEQMRHPVRNTAGPLSLGAMAALMRAARLLVCNDTGVSHIAAGLGLPSVVVFSNADIHRWAPANTQLHRCIWDPHGQHADIVLHHALALLAGADT